MTTGEQQMYPTNGDSKPAGNMAADYLERIDDLEVQNEGLTSALARVVNERDALLRQVTELQTKSNEQLEELRTVKRERKTLTEWAIEMHEIATSKGWHEREVTIPEYAALMHSEVSEMFESFRKNQLHEPCDKPIPLTCLEEELGDFVIRAFDMAVNLGVDIEKAVRLKSEYNRTRSYRHGGKVV